MPVLRDGKVVGTVSRAYLVRTLAATKDDPVSGAYNDDRQIRERLLTESIPKKKGKPRASPVYGASKSTSFRQYSRF